MSIWKQFKGLMTGFLISTGHPAAEATLQHGGTQATPPAGVWDFIVLFGRLPLEITLEFHRYQGAPDVNGVDPDVGDVRVQKRALALIDRAIEYLDRAGPFLSSKIATEFKEG